MVPQFVLKNVERFDQNPMFTEYRICLYDTILWVLPAFMSFLVEVRLQIGDFCKRGGVVSGAVAAAKRENVARRTKH